MSTSHVTIQVPNAALCIAARLEQGLKLLSIPPGSTILYVGEPKYTPGGMEFNFIYSDGKDDYTVSVGTEAYTKGDLS